MTEVRLTGRVRSYGLAGVLRALYGVVLPDMVGTLAQMPDVVFVPEHAAGTVGNGGDEGWRIGDANAPLVTRVNTNNAGWLLGFRPEHFVSQFNFALGHGQVVITPVDDGFTVQVGYPDIDQHGAEQERVAGAVAPLLEHLRVQ